MSGKRSGTLGLQKNWGPVWVCAMAVAFISGMAISYIELRADPRPRSSCIKFLSSFFQYDTVFWENTVGKKLILFDSYKWTAAETQLAKLSNEQKITMARVFDIGLGHFGIDGKYGKGFDLFDSELHNYSPAHLKEKRRILEASKVFTTQEIRTIMADPAIHGFDSKKGDQVLVALDRLRRLRNKDLNRFRLKMKSKTRTQMRQLPKWPENIPGEFRYQPAYARIADLLNGENYAEIFSLMQELELEVLLRSIYTRESGEVAFQNVLKKWESAHGFKKSFALMPEVYSAEEWRKMLRSGALPKDPALDDPFHLTLGFYQHGYDTHRLQMHLIMRDMAAHPEHYQSLGPHPQAVDLFTYMGDEKLARHLDWSQTRFEGYRENRGDAPYPGSQSLWDALFEGDGFQNDFHNPIFIRQMIGDLDNHFFPTLYNIFY